MKFSTALLFTFIVCLSSAQQYKPPSEKVLKEKLNLTLQEFLNECQKNKATTSELTGDRDMASKTAHTLADDLVKNVKTLPEVNEQNWNELIKARCLEDATIKVENESNVNDVNKCLDENKKLNGEKKIDFTKALLEAYCSAVKDLAKEKYQVEKS